VARCLRRLDHILVAHAKKSAAISYDRTGPPDFDIQFVEPVRLRIERRLVGLVGYKVVTLIVEYLANAGAQIVVVKDS